jgi:hypothetical protein
MPHRLVLDRKLLLENPFMTRLKPIQAPPQFTLGLTELEWQGYKATCIRVQQAAAMRQDAALSSTDAECRKKRPNAEALGP